MGGGAIGGGIDEGTDRLLSYMDSPPIFGICCGGRGGGIDGGGGGIPAGALLIPPGEPNTSSRVGAGAAFCT
jgi:hypothetical protein